jgi:hypothetical protein
MFDPFTRNDFVNQLHTAFRLTGSTSEGMPLVLDQVSATHVYRYQEVFSLVFKGPADRLLQQQIYHLEHERLGPVEIFLVPIEKDGNAVYYEAVFNRLILRDQ